MRFVVQNAFLKKAGLTCFGHKVINLIKQEHGVYNYDYWFRITLVHYTLMMPFDYLPSSPQIIFFVHSSPVTVLGNADIKTVWKSGGEIWTSLSRAVRFRRLRLS